MPDGLSSNLQEWRFAYHRSPDQEAAAPVRHPVIVVGAGPAGLIAAVDLASAGVPVLLLDDDDRLAEGSRAICFAKRTLEVFDRLGCGDRVVSKGVGWNTGRVFFGARELYRFDLLAEPGHGRPAFVNIQQYYVEAFLLERAQALPGLEVRWHNRVAGASQDADGVELLVETPDGPYRLRCDYLLAADGAHSAIRRLLGHETRGQNFRDRFLIADVRMQAPFPAERWFWFDPPFHRGHSVLLHRQPDDVWRVDFQLGPDADPAAERAPERVRARVQALLPRGTEFELLWASVYSFSCLRMASFRDRRALFLGDSAHVVSPFGARGANGGVQDAENLAWKLRLVLQGAAPDRLLDSYASEREAAADESIRHSTRSTDFITPKGEASRTFRNAVLELARDCPFARVLVNSGRLSTPAVLARSALNTPDEDSWCGGPAPGAPCPDAPVWRDGEASWLLRELGGAFTLLCFGRAPEAAIDGPVPLRVLLLREEGDGLVQDGVASARFDAQPGSVYLLRPDQHVCARWRRFEQAAVQAALLRATAQETSC